MRIGIKFHRHASLGGAFKDGVHVDGIRFAGKQQSTGGMSQNGHVRVVEGLEYTFSHLGFVHAEP